LFKRGLEPRKGIRVLRLKRPGRRAGDEETEGYCNRYI